MGKPKTTAAPAATQADPAPAEADVVATAATEMAPVAVPDPAPEPAPAPMPTFDPRVPDPEDPPPIESLEDFLRRVEGAHLERDVVATAATHPDATERVWPGTYGGIRLSPGPASVTYSDGTQA